MAAMTAVALPIPRSTIPRSTVPRPTIHRPTGGGVGRPTGARSANDPTPLRPTPVRPTPLRPAPSMRTLRRRRVAAAVVGLLSVAGVVQVAHLGAALLGGGPLTAPEESTSRPAAAHVYVVQPGDTLWSIAARTEPGADPRVLVQRLTDETGGAALRPGQAIVVP